MHEMNRIYSSKKHICELQLPSSHHSSYPYPFLSCYSIWYDPHNDDQLSGFPEWKDDSYGVLWADGVVFRMTKEI